MKTILNRLSEITSNAFAWDAQQSDPLAALTAGGLTLAEAASTLTDLGGKQLAIADESWQSCDACWDPGSDEDPFPR